MHKSHRDRSGNHPRGRRSRSGERKHLVDDVVWWKASFFPPLARLFHWVQSSSEQDCLGTEPQSRPGSTNLSATSGISCERRATCRLPLKLARCQNPDLYLCITCLWCTHSSCSVFGRSLKHHGRSRLPAPPGAAYLSCPHLRWSTRIVCHSGCDDS